MLPQEVDVPPGMLWPVTPLVSQDFKREVLEKLANAWDARVRDGQSPGCRPQPLGRAHLATLSKDSYVVAHKTDGVPYTLFLTRVTGRELAFMIDRQLEVFQIPVAARRSFFENSIFDGELVWSIHENDSQRSQVFLVFDVMLIKGQKQQES